MWACTASKRRRAYGKERERERVNHRQCEESVNGVDTFQERDREWKREREREAARACVRNNV